MKALTLYQPWASLVAIGAKRIETRTWKTTYRGPLAVHAARCIPKPYLFHSHSDFELRLLRLASAAAASDRNEFPRGAVLCICELVDCTPTTSFSPYFVEQLYGDFTPGRWAWMLQLREIFTKPIPARGGRRIWEWDEGHNVAVGR